MSNGKSPWEIALKEVRSIPDYRSLSIIELGCGDGRIVELLSAEGCFIKGTTYLTKEKDHIRNRDYPEHLLIDHGVDLSHPLPYESNSFDIVLCLEAIEHLEVQSAMISEIGRILRPGGVMIMSFPNLGRLVSRLCFALTGVHLTKERRPTETDRLSNIGAFHVHCPDFPFLHWMLWQSNLRIIRLEETIVKSTGALLGALRWVFNMFVGKALRLHQLACDTATNDLEKWMKTRAYAVSEQLVVVARKQ